MVDGITTGLAFVAGLGLPHVLLWVLTFAVVYAVLTKAKVFSRAPAALVSIVVGVFVLLAVPAAVIGVIGAMSTGLLIVATGILVLVALVEVAGARWIVTDKDGNRGIHPQGNWLTGHTTAVAIGVLILTAAVFYISGGAALLGIGIPAFGLGTWIVVLVGMAVLWMLSETK